MVRVVRTVKRKHVARRQLALSVPTRLVDVRRLTERQSALLERVRAAGERGVIAAEVRSVWLADEEDIPRALVYEDPRAALRRLRARGLVREVRGKRWVATVVGERRSVHVR